MLNSKRSAQYRKSRTHQMTLSSANCLWSSMILHYRTVFFMYDGFFFVQGSVSCMVGWLAGITCTLYRLSLLPSTSAWRTYCYCLPMLHTGFALYCLPMLHTGFTFAIAYLCSIWDLPLLLPTCVPYGIYLCYCLPVFHMGFTFAIAYLCSIWDLPLLLPTCVPYGIYLCYCLPVFHMGFTFAIAYPCCIRDLPLLLPTCVPYGIYLRYCLPVLHMELWPAASHQPLLLPCLSFLPLVSRCLLLFQGCWVNCFFSWIGKGGITNLCAYRKLDQHVNLTWRCLSASSFLATAFSSSDIIARR